MNIYPSEEMYNQLCGKCNMLPVFTDIPADLDTPLSLFLKVKGQFLLESVEKGGSVGKYSIIGIGKTAEFVFNENTLTETFYSNGKVTGETKKSGSNPLLFVREYFNKIDKPPYVDKLPPFFGGAIGYLGYETIAYFEKIPVKPNTMDIPDGILVIPEILLVYDNVHRNVFIICCGQNNSPSPTEYGLLAQKVSDFAERINYPFVPEKPVPFTDSDTGVESKYTKEYFVSDVNKIKDCITQGEIIQAVLSQQFSLQTDAPPFELYRTLRILNPSPYLYYLDFGSFQIIGSSPEVMVRVKDGEVLLKPIAGTRPRGKNITEDNKLSHELINDPKERAEHLMLVDLGRNDLGRIASVGSVEVSEYMSIEKYSHVMHIVTAINAELENKYDLFDVIRATFPAGTLSGAPKIRAMQILSETEPHGRGSYGGMILNLGFNGNLDSCITIRTIVLKDGKAYIQAGAGIVADSDPEKEYTETVNKAKALVDTVNITRRRFQR